MKQPEIIKHRVNTLEHLRQTPKKMGAEIDVRYHCNDLVLHHDPLNHHVEKPCLLTDFLEQWDNEGTLILNIKTEGIEDQCISLMERYRIKSWFFLDLSMPYFVKYADLSKGNMRTGFGVENLAIRYSDREPIEYAKAFAGLVGWVWVDCFTSLKLDRRTAELFRLCGYRICLVSPELQGHSVSRIEEFKKALQGIQLDAVCTKFPECWGE